MTLCVWPRFPMREFLVILHGSGSMDAAKCVTLMEVRFWSSAADVNNSLGRKPDAFWLAGTAGVLGIAGNMQTVSPSRLFFCSTFTRSSATAGLFWRRVGIIVSYHQYPLILTLSSLPADWAWTCFQLPMLLFPLMFKSIVSSYSLYLFTFFSSLSSSPCRLLSHIPALLINNLPAPSQHSAFPPTLCVSLCLWRGCQTAFPHTEPFSLSFITPETWPLGVSLSPVSTYGISSSLSYLRILNS